MKRFTLAFLVLSTILLNGCAEKSIEPQEPPVRPATAPEITREKINNFISAISDEKIKTKILLMKRNVERATLKAQFLSLICCKGKASSEIIKAMVSQSSELAPLPWFKDALTVWKQWQDIEIDLIAYTSKSSRLDYCFQALNNKLLELQRTEDKKKVYILGEDPELDKLLDSIEVEIESWNHPAYLSEAGQMGIRQKAYESMTSSIKKTESTIPVFKLKWLKKLPDFPDFDECIKESEDGALQSVLERVKKSCKSIIVKAQTAKQKHTDDKQPELACMELKQAIAQLRGNISALDDRIIGKQKYLKKLDDMNDTVQVLLCRPFADALKNSVKLLEDPEAEDALTLSLEALEGALRQYPQAINKSATFRKCVITIRRHLDYRQKRNDMPTEVIIQRLEKLLICQSSPIKDAGERRTFCLRKGVLFAFRWCPEAKKFIMGSPESEEGRYYNETQRSVEQMKGFWMQETEVTQAQWKAVMGTTIQDQAKKMLLDDTKYDFGSFGKKTLRDFYGFKRDENPDEVVNGVGDDYPMYYVSWDECVEFCRKLSLRIGMIVQLPTETQWEYGCRAGTRSALYNGDLVIKGKHNGPILNPIAWYGGNSSVGFSQKSHWDSSKWSGTQYPGGPCGAHPVRKKEANAWGLYDMTGNVCEWCSKYDENNVSYSKTGQKGLKNDLCHVTRGGGWNYEARLCRSAYRSVIVRGSRCNSLGFRLTAVPLDCMLDR